MNAVEPNEEVSGLSEEGQEQGGEALGDGEFQFEEEARFSGWVPKEEFRGDKSTWLDAETFVRRGKEINPILRANNERLRQSLSALERQNQKYSEELRQLRESQQSINQRDFDTTIQELNRQRMAAMREGQEDEFLRLDQKIVGLISRRSELVEGRPTQNGQDTQAASPQGNVDPVFNQWLNENQWYGQDEFRTVAVNRIAEQMREQYPNLIGRAFLDGVLRSASKRYPEDFGVSYTPDRRTIGDISNRGSDIGETRRGRERELPQDARKAMEKFVKDKLGTREDYMNIYFESE